MQIPKATVANTNQNYLQSKTLCANSVPCIRTVTDILPQLIPILQPRPWNITHYHLQYFTFGCRKPGATLLCCHLGWRCRLFGSALCHSKLPLAQAGPW